MWIIEGNIPSTKNLSHCNWHFSASSGASSGVCGGWIQEDGLNKELHEDGIGFMLWSYERQIIVDISSFLFLLLKFVDKDAIEEAEERRCGKSNNDCCFSFERFFHLHKINSHLSNSSWFTSGVNDCFRVFVYEESLKYFFKYLIVDSSKLDTNIGICIICQQQELLGWPIRLRQAWILQTNIFEI